MLYDLLLKNGHIIDPLNKIDDLFDLAIARGKIAAIGDKIAESAADKVINLKGLYVTPGLVDIHCHLYATTGARDAWAGDCSVLPDGFSFRSGVTTMVDAGSSGWRNFEDFRYRVIDRAATRVFAMINIVGLGMLTDIPEQNGYDMEPEMVKKMAFDHRDIIVGIKSAHYFGPEWLSVERAIAAGDLTNLPVMVDVGIFRPERPYYKLVTEKLRPGDISTHMYRAPAPYVDKDGKLFKYLFEARERGVFFDLGHGGGSFVFRNAVPSIQQGFYPDSISTDLHTASMNSSMMDLTVVISKLMAIGLPLSEAIKETTSNPARIINHPELGNLAVGAAADVAVFSMTEGEFGFADSENGKYTGKKRLFCEMTIKDGKVVWDWNARMAEDYRKLGDSYGIREVDTVVLPEEQG